ncbi:hypothetical protein LTR86_008573 [Recurvomyces mirabilis]|nr:hypothetical protein LTR86_008573 [Recurvomyces mirabilis]
MRERRRSHGNHAPPPSRRNIYLAIGSLLLLLVTNLYILNTTAAYDVLYAEWLPASSGTHEQRLGGHIWRKSREPAASRGVQDEHPIRHLMQLADHRFKIYDADRSLTFKGTVDKYRRKFGRYPPPGFKEWYKFARERHVHNIDDFDQIYADLRPFWANPPADIRHYAAHASDIRDHGVSVVSLRSGQVFQELWGWRSETFVRMLSSFAHWLPDMDIAMNRMDQPRVVVPWEELQEMLTIEKKSRTLEEMGMVDAFTKNMSGFWERRPPAPEPTWLSKWSPFWFPIEHVEDSANPPPDYGWFWHGGKQYMDIAAKACPPDSYARNPDSAFHLMAAEGRYKSELGGFVTIFNTSSDLCTVGPQLHDLHGMLSSAASVLATHKLVPIFGECKVNVNNDILFPANMYWKHDKRYQYNSEQDISWDDKDDMMPWRGVTSGGTAFEDKPERWQSMHRQRLVQLTNSTILAKDDTSADILALTDPVAGTYGPQPFHPAPFAANHTNIGFTEKIACLPNCDFYNNTFTLLNQTTFAQTFGSKYLVDVDGHSFSGRWRAFLQSRSLGLKATIFREWHDSRLWAWRHFVPMDNRYDDLYSLLTYFIGLNAEDNGGIMVPRHDYEAFTLARQGREWAEKVLRREDLEIYLFRLLLEYGRVIDDNRDKIGFVGDGGEEMEEFDRRVPAVE